MTKKQTLLLAAAAICLGAAPALAGPAQPHGSQCAFKVTIPGLGIDVTHYVMWWASVCFH